MPISEISILWLTAGLGCDGDTIAMTAATQPSLEDILSGVIPGAARMKLYNPFLATEVADDLVDCFRRGEASLTIKELAAERLRTQAGE
jgi:hydrogenase small subunit